MNTPSSGQPGRITTLPIGRPALPPLNNPQSSRSNLSPPNPPGIFSRLGLPEFLDTVAGELEGIADDAEASEVKTVESSGFKIQNQYLSAFGLVYPLGQVIDISSGDGAARLDRVFADLNRDINLAGGDYTRSSLLFDFGKKLAISRNENYASLSFDDKNIAIHDAQKDILGLHYQYAGTKVADQQEILLTQYPHPAEYAADKLGEFLGIAKEDRHILGSKQLIKPTGFQYSVTKLGQYHDSVVDHQFNYSQTWIQLLENEDHRTDLASAGSFKEEREFQKNTLINTLRQSVKIEKLEQFNTNIEKLFQVGGVNRDTLNNDQLPDDIKNIRDSYEAEFDEWQLKARDQYRTLAIHHQAYESGDISYFSKDGGVFAKAERVREVPIRREDQDRVAEILRQNGGNEEDSRILEIINYALTHDRSPDAISVNGENIYSVEEFELVKHRGIGLRIDGSISDIYSVRTKETPSTEYLYTQLTAEQQQKVEEEMQNFFTKTSGYKNADNLHDLESLRQKQLDQVKTAFTKIPVLGDLLNVGIDAARGDWSSVGHDLLRTAAVALSFVPGVGPALGALTFLADASWGEATSIKTYIAAKSRGDEAGARNALKGILSNGAGILLSGAGAIGTIRSELASIKGAFSAFNVEEEVAEGTVGEGIPRENRPLEGTPNKAESGGVDSTTPVGVAGRTETTLPNGVTEIRENNVVTGYRTADGTRYQLQPGQSASNERATYFEVNEQGEKIGNQQYLFNRGSGQFRGVGLAGGGDLPEGFTRIRGGGAIGTKVTGYRGPGGIEYRAEPGQTPGLPTTEYRLYNRQGEALGSPNNKYRLDRGLGFYQASDEANLGRAQAIEIHKNDVQTLLNPPSAVTVNGGTETPVIRNHEVIAYRAGDGHTYSSENATGQRLGRSTRFSDEPAFKNVPVYRRLNAPEAEAQVRYQRIPDSNAPGGSRFVRVPTPVQTGSAMTGERTIQGYQLHDGQNFLRTKFTISNEGGFAYQKAGNNWRLGSDPSYYQLKWVNENGFSYVKFEPVDASEFSNINLRPPSYRPPVTPRNPNQLNPPPPYSPQVPRGTGPVAQGTLPDENPPPPYSPQVPRRTGPVPQGPLPEERGAAGGAPRENEPRNSFDEDDDPRYAPVGRGRPGQEAGQPSSGNDRATPQGGPPPADPTYAEVEPRERVVGDTTYRRVQGAEPDGSGRYPYKRLDAEGRETGQFNYRYDAETNSFRALPKPIIEHGEQVGYELEDGRVFKRANGTWFDRDRTQYTEVYYLQDANGVLGDEEYLFDSNTQTFTEAPDELYEDYSDPNAWTRPGAPAGGQQGAGDRQPPPTGPRPDRQPPPAGPRPDRQPPPTGPRPDRQPPPTGPRPDRQPPPAGPRPDRQPPPTGPRPDRQPPSTGPRPDRRPPPVVTRPNPGGERSNRQSVADLPSGNVNARRAMFGNPPS